MILKICTLDEFATHTKNKTVVSWGAGTYLKSYQQRITLSGIENLIAYFIDSDPEKYDTKYILGNKQFDVRAPSFLYDNISSDTVMLISMLNWSSVYEQLNKNPLFDGIECYPAFGIEMYSLECASYLVPLAPEDWRMCDVPQIPKKIHYIWFGGTPIPRRFQHCLDSWKKYCPEYEIIRWNEENYNISAHPFTKEMSERNMLSKVSNFARMDIVYKYGGIYLDVDVELLRPLDDLLFNKGFIGFENTCIVNSGQGFGAVAGNLIIGEFLKKYDELGNASDETNYTLLNAYIETPVLNSFNLRHDGTFQVVADMTVYPAVYFNPISHFIAFDHIEHYSQSIHHAFQTWTDKGIEETEIKNRTMLRRLAREAASSTEYAKTAL